tara:strand:+ start:295 stop:1245 length:951 start_codon:yes stop_codon:yes gene_type:complete
MQIKVIFILLLFLSTAGAPKYLQPPTVKSLPKSLSEPLPKSLSEPLPKSLSKPLSKSFEHKDLKKNKSDTILPKPLKEHTGYKYVLGIYGGYNYFDKKDIKVAYQEFVPNMNDFINVSKKLRGFSPTVIAGLQQPVNNLSIFNKIFLGVKAFYFDSEIKGQMTAICPDGKTKAQIAAICIDGYVCAESSAKVPVKSLSVLLNSRLYFNFDVDGLTAFIEGGLGLNYYKTKLTITGGESQFDTDIKTNKGYKNLYNIGAGFSQSLSDDWYIDLVYNYYHSLNLKSKTEAISGVNLASPIKIKFDNHNVSLGIQKTFL